jgi:hypothetical protein
MLKTGIYTIDQACDPSRQKTILGGHKKISVTLYPAVAELQNGDDIAEQILFHFSDERGAFKRTYAKRFPDFDPAVIDVLKHHFSKTETLKIHDVAVSDGRTAADLFDVVSAEFQDVEYIASDYNPKLTVLQKGKLKVTLSHTGDVLEICWPPFVFNTVQRDSYKFYPINHAIRLVVQALYVNPLVKNYKEGKVTGETFFLFVPRVLTLAQSDARFTMAQHDLLAPFNTPHHVIRAMNILNPSYFSKEEFQHLIGHVYAGLYEGGLFIVGSNEDAGSLVHGGIYQKTAQGFHKLWQSGNGPAIEEFLLKPMAIAA